jgi:UDP-2-acetamido-3-amino-2,3-dideoxy-glucuronate N-acetyltransferase
MSSRSVPPPVGNILDVAGVELVRVPRIQDYRGSLVAREVGKGLPFVPQRCFFIFDCPAPNLRGEHAHRRCAQFLVCARGSIVALVDDGFRRGEVTLDDPTLGLHMPPMIWGTQHRYSADALLMVYASHPYDADDYIRDYDTFHALARDRLALVRGREGA